MIAAMLFQEEQHGLRDAQRGKLKGKKLLKARATKKVGGDLNCTNEFSAIL